LSGKLRNPVEFLPWTKICEIWAEFDDFCLKFENWLYFSLFFRFSNLFAPIQMKNTGCNSELREFGDLVGIKP